MKRKFQIVCIHIKCAEISEEINRSEINFTSGWKVRFQQNDFLTKELKTWLVGVSLC
jgi:hypothetical protein